MISNDKVIELVLQLKSAKAHGKNYIKGKPQVIIKYLTPPPYLKYLPQGEATHFLHCRNCDSLVVVVVVAVANFDPHLTGRHLATIGRDDDCFIVCSFGLS